MVLPQYNIYPPGIVKQSPSYPPGAPYYTFTAGYVPPGVGLLPGNIPPMASNQTPEGPTNPMPKLGTGTGVGVTRTIFASTGVPQMITQWLPHTTPNLDNNYQGIPQRMKMPIRQIVPSNVYPDTYRTSEAYARGGGFIDEQPIVTPQVGYKTVGGYQFPPSHIRLPSAVSHVQYATPRYPGSPGYPPLASAGYPKPTGMSYWGAMRNGIHPVPNVGRINRPAGYSIPGSRPIVTVGGYNNGFAYTMEKKPINYTMPGYTSPQVSQVGYTMPGYTSPQVSQVGYTMPPYTSPQVVQIGYQGITQHMKMPIRQIVPPGVYPDTYGRKKASYNGGGAAVGAFILGAVLGLVGGALIFTQTGRQIAGATGRRAQTEVGYLGSKVAGAISPKQS
jgi:hypothetical protein